MAVLSFAGAASAAPQLVRPDVLPAPKTYEPDCGVYCLAAILKYSGMESDFSTLRSEIHGGSEGASFADIIEVAGRKGLHTLSVKTNVSDMSEAETDDVFAILHMATRDDRNAEARHFLALLAVDRRRGMFLIVDSKQGCRWWTSAEIARDFTGYALFLGRDRGKLEALKRRFADEGGRRKRIVIISTTLVSLIVVGLLWRRLRKAQKAVTTGTGQV